MQTKPKITRARFFSVLLVLTVLSTCFVSLFQFLPTVEAQGEEILRVQGARGTKVGTPLNVTLTSAPISGNVLFATIGLMEVVDGISHVNSITQTGVTWSKQFSSANAISVEIWKGIVGADAGTLISIGLHSSYAGIVDVYEYSGLGSAVLDKTASSGFSGISSTTGTTATTTTASELWIGITVPLMMDAVISQNTPTNNFTLLDGANYAEGQYYEGAGTFYFSVSYLEKIVSATGTANSGTTLSGSSTQGAGGIATFKFFDDITAPTYSSLSSSCDVIGTPSRLNSTWTDEIELATTGGFIIGHNNTGTFTNATWTAFTSNPNTTSTVITLNSTAGNKVQWQVWANDTANNWNNTGLQTITLAASDIVPPTFETVIGNNTSAGTSVSYNCSISDNVAVSGFIPSWNNSGSWVNGTWTSGSSGTLTGTLNSTVGSVVSVKFYANDTANNWSVSAIASFTVFSASHEAVLVQASQAVRLQPKSFFAAGRIWIFYVDTASTYYNSYYVSSVDGITWTAPTQINDVSMVETTGENLAVVLDSAGHVHCVWRQGQWLSWNHGTPLANGTIAWAGSWVKILNFQEPPPSAQANYDFYLALDSTGRDWVTWIYGVALGDDINNTCLVLENANTDGTWLQAQNITITANGVNFPTNNFILPLPNNQMLFGYFSTPTLVYAKLWNGTVLGAEEIITESTLLEDYVSGLEAYGRTVAVDASGNAYFAYVTSNNSLNFVSRPFNTGIWSEETVIRANVLNATSPCFSIYNGTLSIYYIQDAYNIVCQTYSGGTWSTPTVTLNETNPFPLFFDVGYNGRLNSFGEQINNKVGLVFVQNVTSPINRYSLRYASVLPDIINLTDETAPTYSSLSTSTTYSNATCLFNATFTDETALHPNGKYQFGTNNTGSWIWENTVNFTSTPQTISVSKTLNATLGAKVSYQWNFTDNAGNQNNTGTQTITLTNGTAPTTDVGVPTSVNQNPAPTDYPSNTGNTILGSLDLGSVVAGSQIRVLVNVTFGGSSLYVDSVTFPSPLNTWVTASRPFPQVLYMGSGSVEYTLTVPATATTGDYSGSLTLRGTNPFNSEVIVSAPITLTVVGESGEVGGLNPWIFAVLGIIVFIAIVALIVGRR